MPPEPSEPQPPATPQPQRLADSLLELNGILQLAHNRLEEIRTTARQTGHHGECVELIIRLDALREAVEQFKSKVDPQL